VIPVAILVSAVVTGATPPPSLEQVQAWLKREYAEAMAARERFPLNNVEFRWRLELHTKVDPAQVRQWQEEWKAQPDRPKPSKLADAERYLAKGPKIKNCAAFIHSGSEWRLNSSWDETESRFEDWVYTDDGAWIFNENELLVFDKGTGFPQGRDIRGSWDSTQRWEIIALLFPQIAALPGDTIDPTSFTADANGAISARVIGNVLPGRAAGIRGMWDSQAQRLLVSEVTIEDAPGSREPGRRWRFEFANWNFDPVLKRWMTARVDEYWDGFRLRAIIFDGAAPLSTDRFREIIRLPDGGRLDVIRQRAPFNLIKDYRASVQAPIALPTEAEVKPLGLFERLSRPGSWTRYAGWAGVATIVIVVVLLGLRAKGRIP